ncbi:MAG: GNAT family protein [Deinococcales bacterium]
MSLAKTSLSTIILKTPRLYLRYFHKDDTEALSTYRNDSRVAIYQTWESFSQESAAQLIQVVKDRHLDQVTVGEWLQLAVVHRKSHELLGDLAFKLAAHNPQEAEIGYSFKVSAWGQGFAFEALSALLDYAFNNLNLHRIIASTDPRNLRSCRLLERLGMRLEAEFKESLWFKGTWADDRIYAILAREWLQSHPSQQV